jgi:hypothetical protein
MGTERKLSEPFLSDFVARDMYTWHRHLVFPWFSHCPSCNFNMCAVLLLQSFCMSQIQSRIGLFFCARMNKSIHEKGDAYEQCTERSCPVCFSAAITLAAVTWSEAVLGLVKCLRVSPHVLRGCTRYCTSLRHLCCVLEHVTRRRNLCRFTREFLTDLTLMMEAVCTTETSASLYQTTRCNIQDSYLHTSHREKLKSYLKKTVLSLAKHGLSVRAMFSCFGMTWFKFRQCLVPLKGCFAGFGKTIP